MRRPGERSTDCRAEREGAGEAEAEPATRRLGTLDDVSTGDYPAEWEADVVLTDGGTVHVRPVCPADADRLVAFHGRLSHQSIYYRFFSPRPRLSQDDVTRFTTVDYDDRMALVALLGDDLVGIASYDRWPGRREAEVAFTVDDEHQGRGVATVLLEHLAVIARSHGITRFTAEVLPENRKMLSVFKRAGFQAKSQFADGVVAVEMDIDETDVALEAMHQREHVAEAHSVGAVARPSHDRSHRCGRTSRNGRSRGAPQPHRSWVQRRGVSGAPDRAQHRERARVALGARRARRHRSRGDRGSRG